MIDAVLLGACLLAVSPPNSPPGDLEQGREPVQALTGNSTTKAKAIQVPEDVDPVALRARYEVRREKASNTAADQWKLAQWCEKNGLKAEANLHLAAVVRLDPKRESAWRKLGYKRHEGRWMTDDQVREEADQKKANRVWMAKLKQWHQEIHGPARTKADQARKTEAEEAIGALDEPRAVPAVFRELGLGGATDQSLAIQVLGQIESRMSSQALAVLALRGSTAEVRRRATETLRTRNPVDYLSPMIALLTRPLRYEVRPVGGPGSPGVLLVEGERFNVRRFYAPPPPPSLILQPGEFITYDSYGFPIVNHTTYSSRTDVNVLKTLPGKTPEFEVRYTQTKEFDTVQFSIRQSLLEAHRAALSAQEQLANDTRAVEEINEARKELNERIVTALRNATGQDLGEDADEWRTWLAEQGGYPIEPALAKNKPRPKPKPTLDQDIPLAYTPAFNSAFSAFSQFDVSSQIRIVKDT